MAAKLHTVRSCKSCHGGRFVITGNRFYTSKAMKRQKGSDQLAGGFEIYFNLFG